MDREMLKRLADAAFFYEMRGYKFIDLPWTVSEEISNVTKPIERQNFYLYDKVLVASGEQSFLELTQKELLLPGKYYGITPCFRDEEIDTFHHTYFMKLELFQNIDVSLETLGTMIYDAQDYFNMYTPTVKIITEDGFDITTSTEGIELGSYGEREFNGMKYLYGTGVAEPRLTIAINQISREYE